jgi:hypothetical protein
MGNHSHALIQGNEHMCNATSPEFPSINLGIYLLQGRNMLAAGRKVLLKLLILRDLVLL